MVIPNNNPGCRPIRMLNLAGFLGKSEVNGPGTRAVVWVRGCPIHCPGCFNEQFQPFSPATLIPVDELAGTILSLHGIDGVTFSGGEPFAQAGPLAALGERLREDGLIAGPYVAGLGEADPLKGSSNQQEISLGMKIAIPKRGAFLHPACSRIEFSIASDGTVTTTGFPAPALVEQLESRCRGA